MECYFLVRFPSESGLANFLKHFSNLLPLLYTRTSSWDTGRVAPFIEVLITEKMSSVVLLTDRIFIFYMTDVFIGYWLLTDGISIFILEYQGRINAPLHSS